MIIEANKHYINAKGDIIYIGKERINDLFPFVCNNNLRYTSKGTEFLISTSEDDLICEVNLTLYNKFITSTIDKKEFIIKHIELYTGKNINVVMKELGYEF